MITTRTGDDGMTFLIGGRRVRKDNPLIEAIGVIDELDAQLGMLGIVVEALRPEMRVALQRVQRGLYFLEGLLAGTAGAQREEALRRLREGTADIEQSAAAIEQQLPPMKGFVLQGQTKESAQCHVARSVCRRAERQVVAAEIADSEVRNVAIPYINRLSDYLFICARDLVVRSGIVECYVSED